MSTCPNCDSTDPNLVGVEKASGKQCRDPFHCPSPEAHGNPFRYCPHCNWIESATDDGIPPGFYLRETLDGEELVPTEQRNRIAEALKFHAWYPNRDKPSLGRCNCHWHDPNAVAENVPEMSWHDHVLHQTDAILATLAS